MSERLIILDILSKVEIDFTEVLSTPRNVDLFILKMKELGFIETPEQKIQLIKELIEIVRTNNLDYCNILSKQLKFQRDHIKPLFKELKQMELI